MVNEHIATEPPHVRILIIDDDTAILASVRMALEYERYDVVWATTGEAGLALFECAAPDIVLLDVEMPGMGGLEVLRTLHATHESTPVVMMSADRLARTAAICAGAAAFLEKPFRSTADLLNGINAARPRRGAVSGPDPATAPP